MKYKIGDTVRVRVDLNSEKTYNGISVSIPMVRNLAGKEVTISHFNGKVYKIKEDNNIWNWTDPMFVPIERDNCSINKITGYGTVITLEDGTRIYQSKEGHVVQLSTNSTLS